MEDVHWFVFSETLQEVDEQYNKLYDFKISFQVCLTNS